jgi:hypothetical protein
MNERAERLRAYFDKSGPVVWGESDCCAWPAKWIELVRGEPILLPAYRSRNEALKIIGAAGGLLPLAEQILMPLRLSATDEPELGDVGVIRLSDRDVGAIFAEHGIALWRSEPAGAVGLMKPKILKAWTI